MAGGQPVAHVTAPVVAVAERLPSWAALWRAPNPSPMTLDGTNTWVLRTHAHAPAVVVDPGPAQEEHLRAVADHGPVAAVLVTHSHPDHVDGLARFRELTGAPVVTPTPGEPTDLAGLRITAIATPGHTSDSMCFEVAASGARAVLTGDTILGRGTTVVAWPDGDLADYLASLQRLTQLAGLPVLPGHGPPLTDCAAAASYYLTHRRARLEQVRAAVAAGATTPGEVVDHAYRDISADLRGAAEWSVKAQLAYLSQREKPESPPAPEPLDPP